MIDATFVKAVELLAKDGVRASILPLPLEKSGTYGVVSPSGVVDVKIAAPGWHGEKLKTPKDLADFIGHWAQEDKLVEGAVYLSEDAVVYAYSQGDRRDRASCDLVQHLAFETLSGFDDGPEMLSHEDLIRHLRITFRNCFPRDVLELLRSVKFQTGSEATATIKNQSIDQMGKAIKNATSGEQQLPDEIVFRVPVFENHPVTADVWCALEVFPSSQKFRLTPYPSEIAKAMAAALDDVAGVFDADGPPVFRGTVA